MALHVKTIRGAKYVYDVKSFWNKETKKVQKTTTYMGVCRDEKTKTFIPKRTTKVAINDRIVLNYGDVKMVSECLKNSDLFPLYSEILPEEQDTLNALLHFTIIEGTANKKAKIWFDGSYAKVLYPRAKLESQRISEILAKLGDEKMQRDFYSKYLTTVAKTSGEVAIDSTDFPNEINVSLSEFGSHGGEIQKEMKQIMVVDTVTKRPLFFRLVAGNIADVSTLVTTFNFMNNLNLNPKMVIMDAGYYSEKNIRTLCGRKINFLTRLPLGRKLFTKLIEDTANTLEKAENRVVYNKRALFVQKVKCEICGYNGFAYVCSDVKQRGSKLDKFLKDAEEDKLSAEEINEKMTSIGRFVLISNKDISVKELLPLYYTRQVSEQTFGFEKSVLNILPLRVHTPETVRGYCFLCYLALLLSIEINQKLDGLCTFRDALAIGHNHFCEVFDNEILPIELNRLTREIYEKLKIMEVKCSGE